MKKCYLRIAVVILVILILTSVLGACRKDSDGDSQSETKQASSSVAKTEAKTTAKSVATASGAASETANATTVATATSAAGASTEVVESITEESTADDTTASQNESQQSDWAQDIKVSGLEGIVDEGTDLKGATIVLGTWGERYNPIDSPEALPELAIWARRLKAAEEKYNFKLELYVEPGQNSTNYRKNMIQQAMSGVVICDIFRTASSYDFPSNVKNKVIVPLDEYIDYEMPIFKSNKYLYNGSLWKGRHYGITFEFRYACEYLIYNKDLLDRTGQPDILDLVEMNQWNWGTFLDIAKATTIDINGDGIIDQYGVASHSNWYIFKYFLYSNGLTSGAECDENNNVYLIINSPAALRTFQFVSDLAFVHKVYKKSSSTVGVGDYYKGLIAMQVHNFGGVNRDALAAGMYSTRLAPMPIGPDATFYTNTNASQFYVVSIATKYPKEVAQIFAESMIVWNEDASDWSDEVKEIRSKYFPPDWEWSTSNPARMISTEREFKLVYEMMFPYFKPDFTDGFTNLSSRMQALIADPLLKGEKSVNQAVDSAIPELQAIIDEQS